MTNEELVLSIQQGKNPEKCLEELFLQNRGMIAKLAIMTGGAEEQEDLQQQAYFGLIKAVERWDPQGGASFITYASYWIKAEMQRYLKSNALIAIPPNRNDIFVKIRSFDEPIPGADDLVLGDSIPDPENGVEIEQERMEREELKAVLWETVDELGENEAKVLRMRFQDDNTLKECGERMGLSIESIRRIEAKALRRMRNWITNIPIYRPPSAASPAASRMFSLS